MGRETRNRATYIGYPRFVRGDLGDGNSRAVIPAPYRKFDAGHVYENVQVVNRKRRLGFNDMVEVLHHVPFIKWTVDDQAEAVKRGYFVERHAHDNHAIIIPLPLHTFKSDSEVMSSEMKRAKDGDRWTIERFLPFVVQQDQRGWTGTWDKAIETYNAKLIWYRTRVAATRAARDAAAASKPRGRPKGTPYARELFAEQQFKAWPVASGVTFHDWCKTQPSFGEWLELNPDANVPRTWKPKDYSVPTAKEQYEARIREAYGNDALSDPEHAWRPKSRQ